MRKKKTDEFMMDEMIFQSDEDRQTAQNWYEEHKDALIANGGSIINNDRRHEERQDSADLETLECRDENGYMDRRLYAFCCRNRGWLEQISSRRWEDLHELVSNEALCLALKNLTDTQKKVLFWNIIQDYNTAEVAAAMGTSERNIRDIRQRAFKKVREQTGFTKQVRYTKLKKIKKVYSKKLK